ncbi:MAG: hypothetical protein ACSW8A_09320, partial [Lachnospiraceae bacterium]
FMAVCRAEYGILNSIWYIKGYRKPDQKDVSLVKDNVTFIAKSFERQNLAKELCRNITHMYPGVRIIIADDTRKSLNIDMP